MELQRALGFPFDEVPARLSALYRALCRSGTCFGPRSPDRADPSFPLSVQFTLPFSPHSDDERHGLKELAGLDLVTATSDGPKKGIDVSDSLSSD